MAALALTYATLLFGHSLGLHRLLIHRTYRAHPMLRAVLLWAGTLVGMGGPSRVIRIHDTRDWAQRQPRAHPYFSHDCSYLQDVVWQLFARFDFAHPPRIALAPEEAADPVIRHLDRWWRVHALLPALPLFAVFGWAGVVWGVSARILLSTIGHWSVVHLCHHPRRAVRIGSGRWTVRGVGVQASDLVRSRLASPLAGWLTHGECWHSHHHAFPESARIGESHQFDPGFAVLRMFERLGWVHDLRPPRALQDCEDLRLRTPRMASASDGLPVAR